MDLHCYYFPHPTTPFSVLHLHVIQSPFVAFIMLQFHCFVYVSVISISHWVRKSWIQLCSLSSPLYSQHLEYWLTQRRGQALFVNSVTRWWQWWWPGIRRNCYVSTSALFCMMLHNVIREMGEASLTAIQRGFTTPNNSFLYSLESRWTCIDKTYSGGQMQSVYQGWKNDKVTGFKNYLWQLV